MIFQRTKRKKKKEKRRKFRPSYFEWVQDLVGAASEKIKSDLDDKVYQIKKRFREKPKTSRSERVSMISEAQFFSEIAPFSDMYIPEAEELDKKKLFS